MNDSPKTSGIVAKSAVAVVVLVALYLIGFVVALHFGPALRPPVSSVLEVAYWPLIECDQNDIEPFSTVIKWLKGR